MRRSQLGALAMGALLVLFGALVAHRGVLLITTGEPVAVLLGVAVVVIVALGLALLVREWRLASTVQTMADRLAAEGRLSVDDLPRSPGGRVDRAAADAAFATYRAEVESAPEDWAVWFRLGFAYDAAGDRRRAREALRTAARLHRRG